MVGRAPQASAAVKVTGSTRGLRQELSAAEKAVLQNERALKGYAKQAAIAGARLRGFVGRVTSLRTAVLSLTAAGAGFAALTRQTAEWSRALTDVSRRTNVSFRQLQQFESLFAGAGVPIEQFADTLNTLNERIGEFARGDASGELFRELAVQVEDSNGRLRSSIDLYADLANAISGAGSAAERARRIGFASELLGGQFSQTELNAILATGGDLRGAARAAAARTGVVAVSPEQQRSLERISIGIRELTQTARNAAFRIVAENAAGIERMVDELRQRMLELPDRLSAAFGALIRNVPHLLASIVSALGQIGVAIVETIPNALRTITALLTARAALGLGQGALGAAGGIAATLSAGTRGLSSVLRAGLAGIAGGLNPIVLAVAGIAGVIELATGFFSGLLSRLILDRQEFAAAPPPDAAASAAIDGVTESLRGLSVQSTNVIDNFRLANEAVQSLTAEVQRLTGAQRLGRLGPREAAVQGPLDDLLRPFELENVRLSERTAAAARELAGLQDELAESSVRLDAHLDGLLDRQGELTQAIRDLRLPVDLTGASIDELNQVLLALRDPAQRDLLVRAYGVPDLQGAIEEAIRLREELATVNHELANLSHPEEEARLESLIAAVREAAAESAAALEQLSISDALIAALRQVPALALAAADLPEDLLAGLTDAQREVVRLAHERAALTLATYDGERRIARLQSESARERAGATFLADLVRGYRDLAAARRDELRLAGLAGAEREREVHRLEVERALLERRRELVDAVIAQQAALAVADRALLEGLPGAAELREGVATLLADALRSLADYDDTVDSVRQTLAGLIEQLVGVGATTETVAERAIRAWTEFADHLLDGRVAQAFESIGQAMRRLAGTMQSQFERAFERIIFEGESMRESLTSAIQAIAQEIIRLLIIRPAANALVSALGAPFGIPAAQHGGYHRGLTLVGEAGPELVDFRSPAQVYSSRQLQRALDDGGRGGLTVNVTYDMDAGVTEAGVVQAFEAREPVITARTVAAVQQAMGTPGSPMQAAVRNVTRHVR